METSSISKARDILGGTNAFAEALGVKPPTISEWIVGKRPVPVSRCPDIERLTKGEITCELLRPDFDWAFLRQPKRQAAA
jgi:DNA-binding transcriptional regulator YdaS (Cro superfamily)